MEELPVQMLFQWIFRLLFPTSIQGPELLILTMGQTGSVTFIGTVSPAGGNLKEPVTNPQKKAARVFMPFLKACRQEKISCS
jgi:V/A-type H+-transporting ATPase subunit A